GTDAGERVEIERHRLVRAEDAIAPLDSAFGDHLETELQVVLDAEKFFEMVEDQRVKIVDLDRDRGRAAAELPILCDPVHRQIRRMGADFAHGEAEAGADVTAADHDRIETAQGLSAEAA